MLTSKHFSALAACIPPLSEGGPIPGAPAEREAGRIAGWNAAVFFTAHRLADYCATENPDFDRQKFLAACGLPS